MTATFLPPHSGISLLKLVAPPAGVLLLALAPIQARTDGKTEKRYTIYYKRVAYIQGFGEGYAGKQHNNTFTLKTDRFLYDMGFVDGDDAYLDDNERRESRPIRFYLEIRRSFFQKKNCSPRKCPTSRFRMPGEMITKLLSLLPAIVRHSITVIRPQSRFQRRFEWQSEFLFLPEKRPFLPVSPMTRTCIVSASAKSHLRTR